ncbi:hypothetical protein QOT17_020272 [Balamuthia mandrillaris]
MASLTKEGTEDFVRRSLMSFLTLLIPTKTNVESRRSKMIASKSREATKRVVSAFDESSFFEGKKEEVAMGKQTHETKKQKKAKTCNEKPEQKEAEQKLQPAEASPKASKRKRETPKETETISVKRAKPEEKEDVKPLPQSNHQEKEVEEQPQSYFDAATKKLREMFKTNFLAEAQTEASSRDNLKIDEKLVEQSQEAVNEGKDKIVCAQAVEELGEVTLRLDREAEKGLSRIFEGAEQLALLRSKRKRKRQRRKKNRKKDEGERGEEQTSIIMKQKVEENISSTRSNDTSTLSSSWSSCFLDDSFSSTWLFGDEHGSNSTTQTLCSSTDPLPSSSTSSSSTSITSSSSFLFDKYVEDEDDLGLFASCFDFEEDVLHDAGAAEGTSCFKDSPRPLNHFF